MKHIAALSRLNAVPTKAADLNGVFQVLFNIIALFDGILALITTKQDIASGESGE